ncbi:HlyD family secretion protein [Pseudoxanthomonas koreensis]|uniref:HlyD family secretion protein n=1 Tax=Pseudoxanthomonas koreensis TaxID=266061 RepID=UPI0013911FE1|nr:HlyD family secretion protein [Pseudoxanthomonas koreensis]KAF1691404.1 hemolysin secretion protein D [Pseudoxanthomonas koreensis]
MPERKPWIPLVACLLLGACRADPPQALGTREWDRVTRPAPAAERILRIEVREGEQVAAGTPLLQLEPATGQAELAALQAQAQRSGQALQELRTGPREEDIAQARANLASARVLAQDAQTYYERLRPLGDRQLVAAAVVDRARADASSAAAQARPAEAALLELERGTRVGQVAQGEAALAAAQAQAQARAVTLDKLDVVAPRAGRVESLPYKAGDQAPVGAPLAVLLVGEAPHARVYIPEPLRAGVQVGQRATVRLGADGGRSFEGRGRMVRSEPVFTPYYALTGKDAARLSYLAEVQLEGEGVAELPAGLPLRVEFDGQR